MGALPPLLRVPAMRVAIGEAAVPWAEDPSEAVERHFTAIAGERMSGLAFLAPAVEVRVAECRRVAGDWLAAVATPWSIQLVLLPGGGALWEDSAAGLRRRVRLPAGELVFIGDAGEATLPAYQYCPLIAPLDGIGDTAAACAIARDALAAALTPPATPHMAEAAPAARRNQPSWSRRAFLRGREVR